MTLLMALWPGPLSLSCPLRCPGSFQQLQKSHLFQRVFPAEPGEGGPYRPCQEAGGEKQAERPGVGGGLAAHRSHAGEAGAVFQGEGSPERAGAAKIMARALESGSCFQRLVRPLEEEA